MNPVSDNVKHLSASSLGTWDECRLKWLKMYAEGRKGDSIARGNVLGSFVHDVLEGVFDLPPTQRVPVNMKSVAAESFVRLTEKRDWGVINPASEDDFTKEFKRDAWNSLLNALDLEDASVVEVEAIELKLGGEINGVPFKGFIDRLDRADGDTFVVNDYKNGKIPTFPTAKRKAARQLVLYAAALDELDMTVRLARFIYTAHSKIIPVKITDRLVGKQGEALANTWQEMHDEKEWTPTTSPLCAFCPFVLECPEGANVARARLRSGKSVGESTRLLLESQS